MRQSGWEKKRDIKSPGAISHSNIGFIYNYADTALHRDDWCEKLNEIFKQYNLGDGIYHKNCEEIFDLVNQYDGVNTAIKNAKRRMDGFREGKDVPSEYDPGTTVYKVVEELMGYLEE